MASCSGSSAASDDPDSLDTEVIRHLYHHDRRQLLYQVEEIIGTRSYLQHGISIAPGDVVFDVGANVGVAAAFFAVACDANVFSFEPVKPIYDDLLRTIAELPSCVAFNWGLSSSERTAPITYYPEADAMSGLYADPIVDEAFVRACMENLSIPADQIDANVSGRYAPESLLCELRTLSSVVDELKVDRISLLKVDVERSELDVLDGIRDHDWGRIDQVVAEVHDISPFAERLRDRDFSLIVVQEPAMRYTGVHLVYARRT